MKIWNSYGSEHSANLVMIGQFKDMASAEEAKHIIDEITDFISAGDENYEKADRYPDGMLKLLEKVKLHSVGPAELDQFRYDIRSEVKGDKVVITTDEIEISAFLKLLIDKGARVEVYSAHDYPGAGIGRDTRE
jgi:hypothetical protein